MWCFVFPPQKKKTFFSSAAAAIEETAGERGSAALLLVRVCVCLFLCEHTGAVLIDFILVIALMNH